MTPRAATERDLPAIAAFLSFHAQSSVFPLANLEDHGLGGTDPRGVSMALWEEGNRIAHVIGVTNGGMAMPQLPGAGPEIWDQAAAWIGKRTLIGAIGPAAQVRRLLSALRLDEAPTRMDEDEMGLTLNLVSFAPPAEDPDLLLVRPSTKRHVAALRRMRAAYHVEVLGTPPEDAEEAAAMDVERFLEHDSHRLLLDGDEPVAMTGFNATWRDLVQVGGVFTPPKLRRRGYAACALSRHLTEAQVGGARRAVLFTSSPAAVSVYRRLGFVSAEPIAMVLFDGPRRPAT